MSILDRMQEALDKKDEESGWRWEDSAIYLSSEGWEEYRQIMRTQIERLPIGGYRGMYFQDMPVYLDATVEGDEVAVRAAPQEKEEASIQS
jgi:hypothetical protein